MFRPLALYIGLRYTGAKRRNHFISFISLISIIGIGLGVAALITVLSVMNGFEQELRTRILGMASHASISGYQKPLSEWEPLADQATQHPEVLGVAPYVQGEIMLTKGKKVSGAIVRGILPDQEPKVSTVGEHMRRGQLDDLQAGEYRIILGSELAYSLGGTGAHAGCGTAVQARQRHYRYSAQIAGSVQGSTDFPTAGGAAR